MYVANALNQIPALPAPRGLTIGSFDGVHLGHAEIFRTLREKVSPQGTVAALTFRRHPSEVLPRRTPIKRICTLEQRLQLFQKEGVDLAIIIDFNQELMQTTYDTFLRELHAAYPFDWLVRGKGSTLGKDCQGDEQRITELGRQLGYQTLYLPIITLDSTPVSSGSIRKAIEIGDLAKAALLLGRPYSIFAPFSEGRFDLSHYCCPPDGTYTTSHGQVSIHNRMLTADQLNGWHEITFKLE